MGWPNTEQGGGTGQTYPGAHEGNLLVVEAVHSAGEAGSAPGLLSIDAGPGRGGSARAPAGARLEDGREGGFRMRPWPLPPPGLARCGAAALPRGAGPLLP